MNTAPRPAPLARFFDEILLYSGQYALFYILMSLASQRWGFFSDLGHTTLFASLILQTAVLVAWGRLPLVRFFGSLITPVIYAVFEIRGLAAFFLDIGHFNFWFFSILVGGLQALALLARKQRSRVALEFVSTFISVMVFLVVYFYFDLVLRHRELVAAGALAQSEISRHLQITSLGQDLGEFLADAAHVYVVIGGAILAAALALGRVKILRLTERIRQLFGTYVDESVRDRIISADGNLGEAKEVAILFSDIRGFTTISEASAAQQVVDMLNVYFSRWDAVSRAHGGIIDKFIGDAVMILFEGKESGQPSRDAMQCAFAMLDSLQDVRTELAKQGLPVLPKIGIGISYGRAILGNIGSSQRRNYTAIGDTVNTASRLESACKDYGKSLIVSEEVFSRLDDALRTRLARLGEIPLKGKTEQLVVYGM